MTNTIKRNIVNLLAVVCLIPAAAQAQPYKSTFSGFSHESAEANANGDLNNGAITLSIGKDTFGTIHMSGQRDLVTWDGVTFCDVDPDTQQPVAVELVYQDTTSIVSYNNGDQMFWELKSSPASTLCFNFIDGSSTFEQHFKVIGGLGRFEGATGSIVVTGKGQLLQPGHSGGTGTASGQVFLKQGQGKP